MCGEINGFFIIKQINTVFCSVVRHLRNEEGRNSRLPFVLARVVSLLHFFRALSLPKCLTTVTHSIVELTTN